MTRAALAALWLTGCLDAIGPEVGPLQQPAATCNDDSDPARTVSFAADIVGGVFERGGCPRCHTNGGDGVQQSGFDIASYATLRAGGTRSKASIVIDGKPCTSVLFEKIGPAPPFGARMPRNDSPLSAADQQLVHDWISEGARDN